MNDRKKVGVNTGLRVVVLEGPPFCGKHDIVKEAVHRLLESDPMPEAKDGTEPPFLLQGTSPWRKVFEDTPVPWLDPEDPHLSLGGFVQAQRARMRHSLTLMGDIMWGYSFREVRPCFIVAPMTGPLSWRMWKNYWDYCLAKKLEKLPAGRRPDISYDAYTKRLGFAGGCEGRRWGELGFQSVLFCPDRNEIYKLRQKANAFRREQWVQKNPGEEPPLPRTDVSIDSTVLMSESLKASKPSGYEFTITSTWSDAVDQIVRELRPSWKRAIQDWHEKQGTSQPPGEARRITEN